MTDMSNMTHYMELLATNQPWNLLIFMAIPVILAETIAITELVILFTRKFDGLSAKLNKICGILAGFYFSGIFIYLMLNAVIPLTMSHGWRGPADVIAVLSYLSGVFPLAGLALLELGLIHSDKDVKGKLKFHAQCVAVFLVVAHIAMIVGMLNPAILVGHAMPM